MLTMNGHNIEKQTNKGKTTKKEKYLFTNREKEKERMKKRVKYIANFSSSTDQQLQ